MATFGWIVLVLIAAWTVVWFFGTCFIWIYQMFIDGMDERGIDQVRWAAQEGDWFGAALAPVIILLTSMFWPLFLLGG